MCKNVKKAAAVICALSLMAFGFAGCGQNDASDASSAGTSAGTEGSSYIASQEPGYTVSDSMPDGIYSVDLDLSTLAQQDDGTYKVHATIEAYDTYDLVEINQMKEGDTVQVAGQDILVESVETTDTGIISVNGGTEEGGYDFAPIGDDSNGYRTVTLDDYPLYYAVGETDLTIADTAELSDAYGGESTDEPTKVSGIDNVISYMQENYADAWTCGSTSVTIESGVVTQVDRIWVP